MATHTISIAAPAEDEAAAADAIELHCAADGSPLRIAAASGGTWHVVARNAATFTRLAHEAMRCPAVERVPGFGGLLSATSVLENIVLPLFFNERMTGENHAPSLHDAFEACAMGREQ